MSIDRYIHTLMSNIESGTQQTAFRRLIGALDNAYDACMRLEMQIGPIIFGRFLLICRKSMMSAAALIASSQPEDSVGLTRRAVECARTALAIKLNDENASQWLSFRERHDRWLTRQANERPRSFQVRFADIRGDEYIESLDRFLGILSDAYVHFTPEYYNSLDWDDRTTGDDRAIFLNYFHRDGQETERYYNMLAAVHGRILQVFDRCFDGRFSGDAHAIGMMNAFWAVAGTYSDNYARLYGLSSTE